MVDSALYHVDLLEQHGFDQYKISVKASDVFMSVAAYQKLAEAVDCPLHIGITEAGGLMGGTVRQPSVSAISMGRHWRYHSCHFLPTRSMR